MAGVGGLLTLRCVEHKTCRVDIMVCACHQTLMSFRSHKKISTNPQLSLGIKVSLFYIKNTSTKVYTLCDFDISCENT